MSFGLVYRPSGNADLHQIEAELRAEMSEHGTSDAEMYLVPFRRAAAAEGALSGLKGLMESFDYDGVWRRIGMQYKTCDTAILKQHAAEASERADEQELDQQELDELWDAFTADLKAHDFTYNTQDLDEAEWNRHNDVDRRILQSLELLRDAGKGELADSYYDKHAVGTGKRNYLPADSFEPLMNAFREYESLLKLHNFHHREKATTATDRAIGVRDEERIFELRKYLHAMGQGLIVDSAFEKAERRSYVPSLREEMEQA